ncbi:putative esterase C31F10.02 [Lachnellula arida]|uniref:Putative esterase C31F10.02 n=1 Tax=Lachnellula arida TaxID=1316785 RepID=A0A8T9BAR0_9HELO|nr:putative esterase C31F10.02 [Lachnellula arida]
MAALRFVRSVLKSFQLESGLEPRLLGENLRVTAAEPGRVEFELDIRKEHTNRLSIMHGGTIASMVDLGGSLAVASRGLYATGVSTDLNGEFLFGETENYVLNLDLRIFLVTYLNSGGQVGDVLKAIVKCDKFGKTLAYTSIEFINGKGEIAARGSHTKYVALAWKHPENIVEQLSPRK